ncbi:sulfur oxidation c-type cytochrome SoxA [Methylomicrobium lacus]|uniref:sulfur oxidation c-type cytochrome SoxA n=1 Tax=Methylomicrobium lacus TaxID=136992 RepID=UPI00045E8C49|nr:sulfur oxidation c-type cytochrome SoxA [Methylomicrobium lacus]
MSSIKVCVWHLAPLLFIAHPVQANPQQDQQQFRDHYRQLFPQLQLSDYANGAYAIDPVARESWRAIEEFPPYEAAIEQGEKLFNTPFPQTGRHYADCFPDKGIGIAHRYPAWDKSKGEVVILATALNDCRASNGEPALDAEKGEITQLLAYMAYTSRGNTMATVIPEDDPRALAAYRQGKDFYYTRRGQLNFACATCHVQNAGKRIRSEILSASLGHTTNWPTYRLKWGEMGTLHRRFRECLAQIKAEAPPADSEVLRNLEYFLSYLSNGIPITGPSTRK